MYFLHLPAVDDTDIDEFIYQDYGEQRARVSPIPATGQEIDNGKSYGVKRCQCFQCGLRYPLSEEYFDEYTLLRKRHQLTPKLWGNINLDTRDICLRCRWGIASYDRTQVDRLLNGHYLDPIFIYALSEAHNENATPFYIGQTNSPVRRYREHVRGRYKGQNPEKDAMIDMYLYYETPPRMIIMDIVECENADSCEYRLIEEGINEKWPLTNKYIKMEFFTGGKSYNDVRSALSSNFLTQRMRDEDWGQFFGL